MKFNHNTKNNENFYSNVFLALAFDNKKIGEIVEKNVAYSMRGCICHDHGVTRYCT